MAYNVSQLRKDNNTTYMESVPVSPIELNSPNIFYQLNQDEDSMDYFKDFGLKRTSGTFQTGHTYYLRFKIKRPQKGWYSENLRDSDPSKQKKGRTEFINADIINFTILLKNDQGEDEEKQFPPQEIGTCTINPYIQENEDRYANFSFIFTPLRNFNSICFRIQRDIYDILHPDSYPNPQMSDPKQGYKRWLLTNYQNSGGDNIYYSFVDGDTGVGSGEVSQVFSIINNEQKYWLKVGYQSRPGSLIVINGEPIRIGRSGIYQLNNGIKIKSFMVVAPGGARSNDNIDAFLLDYAYATKQ